MAISGIVYDGLEKVGVNEIILVSSLLYLCADIVYEWKAFAGCSQPVNLWLLGSYLLVVVSRCIYVVGSLKQPNVYPEDFLLNLRQRSSLLRYLVKFTWLALMPAFSLWTFIGTAWLHDVRNSTPTCLPSGSHLWFLVVWQVLSYLWILIHGSLGFMAWFLERRVKKAESDLQQIEDDDLLSRWGQVSQLSGYAALQGMISTGLTPEEISTLPSFIVPEPCEVSSSKSSRFLEAADDDCPICLNVFKPGDAVRKLNVCGHHFHRCCIDLWLLRSLDCPLCKRKVLKVSDGCGCMYENFV